MISVALTVEILFLCCCLCLQCQCIEAFFEKKIIFVIEKIFRFNRKRSTQLKNITSLGHMSEALKRNI